MSRPSFAISTHLYHDERLSRDHLVEIAAHGFDAIELFANRPHFPYEDEAAIAELEEGLSDTGLRLHSIHAPIAAEVRGGQWKDAYSIAGPGEETRTQALGEIQGAMGIARRISVSYLVLHVGVPEAGAAGSAGNSADPARRSIEALHAAAEPLDLRLALEVIPNRLSTPERLVSLIEDDLDLAGLGICCDFGHAHLMGDVVDAVETVSGHLFTTHVHDNAGRSDDHLMPFDGSIPWDPTLMALQKIGFDGAFVFELAASARPRQVLERAARVRQRFESLLGA